MKKLLLLAVTSVAIFAQSTDYRESLKSYLYEEYAHLIEESDPENPDFHKRWFREVLEELCAEKNNNLQLLEQPMNIPLSRSTAYVLVTGDNILNATPVLIHVGQIKAGDKWGSVLLISRADSTGFKRTSYFYLKETA